MTTKTLLILFYDKINLNFQYRTKQWLIINDKDNYDNNNTIFFNTLQTLFSTHNNLFQAKHV